MDRLVLHDTVMPDAQNKTLKELKSLAGSEQPFQSSL